MWGAFVVAHCGQTLRAGRERVQLAARRLRVLALLVLRFGTAIDLLFQSNGRRPSRFF
jgi:DNA-binding winged helix-turn-helix (wHTH) protein